MTKIQGEQVFSFGPYQFDRIEGQLWRGTQSVKITPKALAVLRVFASRPGQVVTKEELLQGVWAGTAVSDTALTSCIKELRRALRDDARQPRYLETVHRRGYRFIVPLSTASTVRSLKYQVQSPRSKV